MNYRSLLSLRVCSNNYSNVLNEMEKSLLNRTAQLFAYAAWSVELLNTVGIACHLNGSKAKNHSKISGTTRRISLNFSK